MSRLLVAMTVLIPAAAMAIVPVNGTPPTPTLTPVTINDSAGDQTDPHVSGDWAAYASDLSIRYYNFATAVDAPIPMGSSLHDLLSDVSGSRVVFSRITLLESSVMVFDAATPAAAPIAVDPVPGSKRLGAAIGGNTVAYVDFGLDPRGELVVSDLSSLASTRLTTDTAYDQNPSVSPDGNVVTWEHCATDMSNCDIWQAVKTGALWSVSVVSDSLSPDGNPDTNGALVVYDSQRGVNPDIFWKPVGGGTEVQLELPGLEHNPSIAGNFIAFESRATFIDATDIFVYDLSQNKLYQITNTPLVNEQLNDISLLPNGNLRLVWASDENGMDQRNIHGATFFLGAAPASCPNRNVVLDASRVYGPTHATDASAAMTPAMSFALPASIPVTSGNAGNSWITLSFRLGNGQTTTCHYESGSHYSHPASAAELAKASNYNFDFCYPSSCGHNSLHAGSVVTADHVTLHVAGGDSSKPATAVRATLGEVCVTPPAPEGHHGHQHEDDEGEEDSHHDDDSQGQGHHEDHLTGAPDAKTGPMGCSSAGGAPTVLLLLTVAAWLLVSRRVNARLAVRSRR